MTRVLLVPDLPLERWPAMDRYAHRLYDWLESADPGFEVPIDAASRTSNPGSAVRLARERRPGVRGAARGVDRRHHARTRQRPAALGGVSPLVGTGCGPDQVRPTGPPARAAALLRALFPLSVVAQARREARAAGAHPRSHLRPHGDAGAPPPRGGDGARSHAGDHPALPHRRLA